MTFFSAALAADGPALHGPAPDWRSLDCVPGHCIGNLPLVNRCSTRDTLANPIPPKPPALQSVSSLGSPHPACVPAWLTAAVGHVVLWPRPALASALQALANPVAVVPGAPRRPRLQRRSTDTAGLPRAPGKHRSWVVSGQQRGGNLRTHHCATACVRGTAMQQSHQPSRATH